MSDKRFAQSMLLWSLMFCAVSLPAPAQEQDSLYCLTVFFGGGVTHNLSVIEPISGLDMQPDRNGVGGFVRIMWKPEHLLRVGLETGVSQLYSIRGEGVQTSFGKTDISSYLNVIPFSLTFSMYLTKRLEGYIASTSYLLFSNTRSFGNSVSGTMFSIGFSAALTYLWPIDQDWNMGCELKWYHIDKSGDDNMMIHVVFSYRFLEW